MSGSDAIRLRHMLDAARDAVQFGAGRISSDLARDRVLALALVRCIEIIGEAGKRQRRRARVGRGAHGASGDIHHQPKRISRTLTCPGFVCLTKSRISAN